MAPIAIDTKPHVRQKASPSKTVNGSPKWVCPLASLLLVVIQSCNPIAILARMTPQLHECFFIPGRHSILRTKCNILIVHPSFHQDLHSVDIFLGRALRPRSQAKFSSGCVAPSTRRIPCTFEPL
jgi:hypothetical protein